MKRPLLMVMAGPNGSGKSTVTKNIEVSGYYVNADDIQRQLSCSELEAAQIAEATREHLLSERADFTFETVASTDRNYKLMQRAKAAGYKVVCVYVLTNDYRINVRRVAARKRNGGHDVPPEKVVIRYGRAMKLFPWLFSICDELYVYDNSPERGEGAPSRILNCINGAVALYPNEIWSQEMLEALCAGSYEPK